MLSTTGVAVNNTSNGDCVELFYEELMADPPRSARPADQDDPPVLLIMGLGAQLLMWPDGFCEKLVAAGHRVIRFDHRDVGLSAKMEGRRADGSVYRRLARYLLGLPSPVPYTLVDMADDARALLDHLGIARAHVVGASMGGMIAQILAATSPERVASLGIIMSSAGRPFSAAPAWRVIKLAFHPPGPDASPEEKLAYEVRNVAVINGPNFLPSDDELRRRVQELAARSEYTPGMLRQFDAVLGTGSLVGYARQITAPTVVLHGSADPMLRLRNGRAVAATIPDARFVVIDGMGHDLPRPVWRPVAETLIENFAQAPISVPE